MSFRDVSRNQRRGSRFVRVGASVALTLTAGIAAHAQTYTLNMLAAFDGTNGSNPQGNLVRDSNGNLYGGALSGGGPGYNGYPAGTVFEVAAGTNTLSTVVTFNGTDGQNPEGGLMIDSSGNIYGATQNGGTDIRGNVFKIAAGTNALSTLVNFDGTNGLNPYAGVTIDSSGNLYGTTAFGGPTGGGVDGDGTVYEIAAGPGGAIGGGAFTTLANFNGTNGLYPAQGLTVDSRGDLFGTTIAGGSGSDGTVFEIVAGTSTITTLVNFSGTNGQDPAGSLLLDSSGNLYGTTYGGGTASEGTVFKIAAGTGGAVGGGAFTSLASFTGANGENPAASLTLDGSGNLYGTTEFGGDLSTGGGVGDGTVFAFSTATNTLTTLATFNGTNGANPATDVLLDGNGDLYGTTAGGGDANGDGTVFELTPIAAAAAPEPSALLLLAPGALGLVAACSASHKRNRQRHHAAGAK